MGLFRFLGRLALFPNITDMLSAKKNYWHDRDNDSSRYYDRDDDYESRIDELENRLDELEPDIDDRDYIDDYDHSDDYSHDDYPDGNIDDDW